MKNFIIIILIAIIGIGIYKQKENKNFLKELPKTIKTEVQKKLSNKKTNKEQILEISNKAINENNNLTEKLKEELKIKLEENLKKGEIIENNGNYNNKVYNLKDLQNLKYISKEEVENILNYKKNGNINITNNKTGNLSPSFEDYYK